jgi:hypothetical protein
MIRTASIASAICFALAFLSLTAFAEPEAHRQNVADYFLVLPDKTFEGPAKDWLKFLRQPKSGVYDLANGYLSCTGDGAQPPFEVALFRYKDGRPLLAVCQGELEGQKERYLSFYEQGPDGSMHEANRKILPMPNDESYRYELPRKGRTVLIRDAKTGRVRWKYTWDGTMFFEDWR